MVKQTKKSKPTATAKSKPAAARPAATARPAVATVHAAAGSDAPSLLEQLRNSWFLILFVGTVIYWAARHDSSLGDIKKIDARETSLESRVTMLESGIAQLQLKIDGIKEDVTLIKSAVIK